MSISQKVREEMLPRLRQGYVNRGREGRTRMIDELCEQFAYSRKHAIKLLGASTGWGGDAAVRDGASHYAFAYKWGRAGVGWVTRSRTTTPRCRHATRPNVLARHDYARRPRGHRSTTTPTTSG